MSLSRPEQLIKITMLLRTVPEALETNFCSTSPACEKFCLVDGKRDKSKCALLTLPEEEVRATIMGLDAAGRLMGVISDD